MKNKMTFGQLQDIFNKHAAEIETVTKPLWAQGLMGLGSSVDEKTNDPILSLIFQRGAKPNLSEVPKQIGALKVSIEYRGPAKAL